MENRNATAAVIGAGDFIGAAIAKKFASEGFTVFAGRRHDDKLVPLVAEIEAAGGPVVGRSLDARKEEQITAFLQDADMAAPLEVCIFNVGANVNFQLLYIGWRGMLWLGILPAFAIIYIRIYVKEPAVWVENRRRQRVEQREMRTPFFALFKRGVLGNTLGACWFMAAAFITYYSINSLFAAHLQSDLHLSTAMIATPIAIANLLAFLSSAGCGWLSDRIGRRWAMILPALFVIPLAPFYLFSSDLTVIAVAFALQGLAGSGGMFGQVPSSLNERFPTEVRATATAFCYHQGAIWGGLCAPVLAYFATNWQLGLAIPMLVGTVFGAVNFIIALLLAPETKGKELVPDLVVA